MDLEVARLDELSFLHNSSQLEYLFTSRSCHRKFLVAADPQLCLTATRRCTQSLFLSLSLSLPLSVSAVFNKIKNVERVELFFKYISNKMQRYTVYFIWKLLYMFRMVPPPIIRSANSCIYSIWYLSYRYCYLPL